MRSQIIYNLPLYELILKRFKGSKKFIECGCGSGINAIILSFFGYEVTGIDIDDEMIKFSKENAKILKAYDVKFIKGDIFKLSDMFKEKEFDLAYSIGVIEHFREEQAIEALKEMAKIAEYVLTVVPSIYVWKNEIRDFEGYWEPYTIRRLRKIHKKANLKIIDEIGYGTFNKLGGAIKLFLPPVISKRILKYYTSTIAVLCKSP